LKKIYIRVDGNSTVGYGHLFRCIALANVLKSQYHVIFIENNSDEFAISHFQEVSNGIIHVGKASIVDEATYLSQHVLDANSILVLDGYQFTSHYQEIIKSPGCKLVCYDDFHNIHFYADVVINQAFGVSASDYSAESYTKFCLGFDWLIQRPSFIKAAAMHREITSLSSMFFTLGGGPIFSIAPKVFDAIELIPAIEQVVFLKGNEHVFEKDVKPATERSSKKIKVVARLDDAELCSEMLSCGMALCPASVISLEACSVGMGLFAGTTADNQHDTYSGLLRNEMAFDMGDLTKVTTEQIATRILHNFDIAKVNDQVRKQKAICNGENITNIVHLFETL